MRGSSSHYFHDDIGLCLNRVNKLTMLFPFPTSVDDNKSGANYTALFLFRSLGRSRRNRLVKSFRSRCEVSRLVLCVGGGAYALTRLALR
jgi:hypothetical protein